jgi:hypothetical protein
MSVRTLLFAGAIATLTRWLPVPPETAAPGRRRRSLTTVYLSVLGSFGLLICLATVRVAIDSSLWIDEFGTLWVARDGAADVIDRAYAFQGQSPFYYLLPWATVRVFGESEIALRTPSICFALAGSVVIGRAAHVWFGNRAGWLATLFALSSPPFLEAGINARPYALALLAYAAVWLGYAHAARGEKEGRLLLIVAASALFWAHYLLAIFLLGIGAAHLLIRPLRRQYSLRAFVQDSAVIAVLCAPAFGHLHSLWVRRGDISPLPEPNYDFYAPLLGPSAVSVAVALVCMRFRWGRVGPRLAAAIIAVGVPLVFLSALPAVGVNLMSARYGLPAVLGGVFCAAGALSHVAWRPAAFGTALFISTAVVIPLAEHSLTLVVTIPQEWRSVRSVLEHVVSARPAVPVLYRSGFVEQDGAMNRRLAGVHTAPLRPPGFEPLEVRLIPMTYTWSAATQGDDLHLRTLVVPAVENADEFYFVSSINYSPKTGEYAKELTAWLRSRLGGDLNAEFLDCCRGVEMVRFTRQVAGSPPSERHSNPGTRAHTRPPPPVAAGTVRSRRSQPTMTP